MPFIPVKSFLSCLAEPFLYNAFLILLYSAHLNEKFGQFPFCSDLPNPPPRQDDDEWIYRMQANMQSLAQDKLSEVWDAYCTGQYRTARTLVGQLAREKLPAWYPDHLYRLVEEALQQGTADPIKCLQPFSWTMHKPATSYKPRSSIVSP